MPPLATVAYFERVVQAMGQKKVNTFMRLFLAPGMAHCGGGIGPNSFGQHSAAQGDPEHSIQAALERWVEEGIAPNRIVATKYTRGADPASGVQRTRPLCPYPQTAGYKGSGSIDDATNFVCAP